MQAMFSLFLKTEQYVATLHAQRLNDTMLQHLFCFH